MKLLLNDDVYGWRMIGILGKDAKWFLGFSRNPKNPSPEKKMESLNGTRKSGGVDAGVGCSALNFLEYFK